MPGREKIGNGIIAILSIRYPDVAWAGCIKSEIGNPELESLVEDFVVGKSVAWFEQHPATIKHLETIQSFQFPHAWQN